MASTAIGSVGGFAGLGALGNLGGLTASGSISSGAISSLLTTLNAAANAGGTQKLDPATQVALSEAARKLLGSDASNSDASLTDLSQALILALILQLLK